MAISFFYYGKEEIILSICVVYLGHRVYILTLITALTVASAMMSLLTQNTAIRTFLIIFLLNMCTIALRIFWIVIIENSSFPDEVSLGND